MSDIDDELFALAGGDEDADVEEGEASSVAASSPNSLGSGDMDESDSDREEDVPPKTSDVAYPLEGKYHDAKDKTWIMSLPVIEREKILADRADEAIQSNFRAQLARRAKENEKSGMQGDRKRKASSVEPDDSQRKSSRQKTKGKTNDKLEAYKREREQRGQQRQRLDERRGRRSSSGDRDAVSDQDAEGESDVDWDEQAKQVAREDQPAALMHFEAVRVGRGFFSKVCFFPGFEEAMTGTYARIGTGQDAQKRTLYKMAQIKGFAEGSPYIFEGKNGQRIATDQYVVAQHGTVKKHYNFSYLSNGVFTEADFDTYKQSLADTGAKIPTQSFLKKKFDDIRDLENRFWTDADITARINKSQKHKALLVGKSEHLAAKIPSATQIESERIAILNQNNRKQESERVRKALIEERRHVINEKKRHEKEYFRKKAEEEARKQAEEEKAAEKAAKKANLDDLFEGDSRAGTPRAGTPKPGEKKKEPKKGLPTFRKPKMDDDIIASMDIGVEIEI